MSPLSTMPRRGESKARGRICCRPIRGWRVVGVPFRRLTPTATRFGPAGANRSYTVQRLVWCLHVRPSRGRACSRLPCGPERCGIRLVAQEPALQEMSRSVDVGCYRVNEIMFRFFAISLAFAVGCSDSSELSRTAARVTPRSALVPFIPLQAGERPDTIDGADVKDIHFFHQNHPPAGTLVCVEGTYARRFQQLGIEYTILKCPECDADVRCAGNDLLRYDIPVGSRLLVRARLPRMNGPIENCTIVTQAAIDAASAEQAAAATAIRSHLSSA